MLPFFLHKVHFRQKPGDVISSSAVNSVQDYFLMSDSAGVNKYNALLFSGGLSEGICK